MEYKNCSQPMRLLFRSSTQEKTVATVSEGKIEFYDEILKKVMESHGIQISTAKRESFAGRRIVFLADGNQELFIKAFKEIYYPHVLERHGCSWELLK